MDATDPPDGSFRPFPPEILAFAFRAVTYDGPLRGTLEALVGARFPGRLGPDEIDDLRRLVEKLIDAGYDLAEAVRDRRMTEDGAAAEILRRHPAANVETCRSALGWGFFLSR